MGGVEALRVTKKGSTAGTECLFGEPHGGGQQEGRWQQTSRTPDDPEGSADYKQYVKHSALLRIFKNWHPW